jgi:hypothetical protein
LKSLFSIAFSFFVVAALSQTPTRDTASDTTTAKVDTVKNRYLPTGIRIGTDVMALVRSQVRDNFSGWEVNGDVDFSRYYLSVDYGQWQRTLNADSSHYKNDGRYFRVGIDVNFLKKDPERNMFFLGFRYARATHSESMSSMSFDPVWGLYTEDFHNPNVTSRWLELTGGIKVKMWKMIWMGYTARFKFGLKSTGDDQMTSHDVPGYGTNYNETTWGFNYQIFVRIPFRKMPPLPQ